MVRYLCGWNAALRLCALGILLNACNANHKPGETSSGVQGSERDAQAPGSSSPCALGTDNCSAHATCTDTPKGFSCACKPGFSGDGVICADEAECALGTDN